MICVSLSSSTTQELLASLPGRGANIIECRWDLMGMDAEVGTSELPILTTIRSNREGGRWIGTETERLTQYKSLLASSDWLDVEINSEIGADTIDMANSEGLITIASYHNFDSTPGEDQLKDIIEKGRSLGADIVKLAVTPNKLEDLSLLVKLTIEQSDSGIITVCLGKHGLYLRLALPLIGSRIAYTTLHKSGTWQLDDYLIEKGRL